MKKLLSILISSFMLISFCACGSGNSSQSSVDSDANPMTDDEIQAMYTDPDSFKGRSVEFTAEVFSVEEDSDGLYIQAYHDITNYDQNTVIYYEANDVDLNEDDFIKVSGTVKGEFSAENAFGGTITAPAIIADKVTLITAVEAIPAEKTVDVNQTVTSGVCSATVSKVDFTTDETRVYISITNNGSDEISVYADQGVIVQNGSQYETTYSMIDYGDLASDIQPGVTTEGIITFDRIEESDFTLTFDGYDYDYNDLTFKFDIPVA